MTRHERATFWKETQDAKDELGNHYGNSAGPFPFTLEANTPKEVRKTPSTGIIHMQYGQNQERSQPVSAQLERGVCSKKDKAKMGKEKIITPEEGP